MDQLKPPTDSLYKFLAIFGLVAYLGSYYLAYQMIDNLFALHVSIADKIEDSDGKKNEVLKKTLEGQTEGLDEFIRGLPKTERAPFASYYFAMKKVEWLTSDIRWMRRVGLAAMVIGFVLWFVMIQRHIDLQLYRESFGRR